MEEEGFLNQRRENNTMRTKHWTYFFKIGLCTTLLTALSLILVQYFTPLALSQTGFTPYLNRRFGYGVTYEGGAPTQYNIEPLNAGWYWDWAAKTEPTLPDLEYIRTVRLKPSGENDYTSSPSGKTLRNVIKANPGVIWSIANEPDCVWMDNVRSDVYAKAYHDLYYLIKGIDPTARVAAGNIVQPTPQRMTYLDRVLAAYEETYAEPLPADLWIIHNYTLCENCWPYPQPGEPFAWGACRVPDWPNGSPEDIFYSVEDHWELKHFAERVMTFRQWMYDNGYQHMPLYISEYGILFYDGLVKGKTVQDNVDFMNTTFDWMRTARDPDIGYPEDDNRLVQRWAWFSLDHDGWYMGGDLFDYRTHQPKALADAYAAYTDQVPPTIDLRLMNLGANITSDTSTSEAYTSTLHVTVANAGNIETTGPVTVTFYRDPANPTRISSTPIENLWCCGDHQVITATLPNISWTAAPQAFAIVEASTGHVAKTDPITLSAILRVKRIWAPIMHTMVSQTVTATLNAVVANAGEISTRNPVTVTFYVQQTATLIIGQVKTVAPLDAHSESETITVQWPNLTEGSHTFCVQAHTPRLAAPPVCSAVLVNPPYNTHFPLVFKNPTVSE